MHRNSVIYTLVPSWLSSGCHRTILFCLRSHNRPVQYSETKSCQPRHTLTHSDTGSIALPYSPEWDQETRCCVMDRHNHRVFSCRYTSVKCRSIFHVHRYSVWQEMWYRLSGYWLKNSFAGRVYCCLVLLAKCWCLECACLEYIWWTKDLTEPYYCYYYLKVMCIIFYWWVAVTVSILPLTICNCIP